MHMTLTGKQAICIISEKKRWYGIAKNWYTQIFSILSCVITCIPIAEDTMNTS